MTPAALTALAKGDIANFLVASIPGGIQAQEKQGQMEQAQLSTLPKDLFKKEVLWEQAGFIFNHDQPQDGLFQSVTFPQGWRKVPTEHNMWTDIVDEHNRTRGAIFYKAAFYDQRAHASLTRRFSIEDDYTPDRTTNTVYIKDSCGVVSRKIDGLKKPDYSKEPEEAPELLSLVENAENELEVWLSANYPDWMNPNAYWDETGSAESIDNKTK